MRLPRLRTLMIAVAVVALVALVATNHERHNGITDKRVVVPVACIAAAAYGVASMRRPALFLTPLVAIWVAAPTVDHPTRDVVNVSAAGCFLGWIIGAPVGWLCSKAGRGNKPLSVANEPRTPGAWPPKVAMSLPRMTTRRWMIAVATLGITMGVLIERHRRFARIAAEHFPKAGGIGVQGAGGHAIVADLLHRPVALKDSAQFEAEIWWHREMWEKYRYASTHPWLPVWPDPPMSEE